MKYSDLYRYSERALYKYHSNTEKLAEYESALEYLKSHGDLRVQTYQESTGGGSVSDRVSDYVHNTHLLERKIRRLSVEVGAVTKACERIERSGDTKLCRVLAEIYFAGKPEADGIDADETNRLKYEIVKLTIKYMKRYAKRGKHRV